LPFGTECGKNFINSYENKLVEVGVFTNALNEVSRLDITKDNPGLIIKALNKMYTEPLQKISKFSKNDEQIADDYLDLLFLVGGPFKLGDCIEEKAYQCLNVCGNYINDVTKLITDMTGYYSNTRFLLKLLVQAFKPENAQILDIS
jgi:hypothetical protein